MAQPAGWSTTNMLFANRSLTFTATDTSTALDFASLDTAGGWWGPVIGDIRVIEIPAAVTTVLNNDPTLSYDAATGKFYRFVSTITQPLSAISAATSATLNGINGQLATIRSAYENELIRAFAQQVGGDVLLGGRDATTEATWRFLNGATESEQFSTGSTAQAGYYANWKSAEPNGSTSENQLAIRPDGEWQDVPDNQARAYVIEWDASEVLSNFRYSLTSNPSGAFAINANTGEITVSNSTPLNEVATNPTVTVQVTDAAGNTYSEVMTISVTPVNDNAPVITSNGGGATASINVAEGATAVTTITATDADLPAQTLTYSIVGGADSSLFSISSTTGALSFITGRNFEAATNAGANNVYDIIIRADDGTFWDVQAIAVTITDVNEAPNDITLGTTPTGLTTAGNTSLVSGTTYQLTPNVGNQAGTVWGAVNLSQNVTITSKMFFGANDAGADGMSFAFQNQSATASGGGAAGFGVNGITGAFGIGFDTYFNGLNNEINSDSTQFFRQGAVTNQGTAFDTANAHDNLEDGLWRDVIINWNATTKTLSYSLDGVAIESMVYDVVATDWGGNANGWFGFGAATGGSSNQQQVEIISVQTGGVTSIAENSANGTIVGVATAIDPDRTGTVSYTLTDNAGGRFAIASATGQITVANGSLLDFESAASHAITVRATDQGGLTYDEIVTINLTNVDEAPVIAGLDGDVRSYTEGDSAVLIGSATGITDVDSTDFNTGTAGSDSAEDLLGIRNEGTGAGQIGISGSNVSYGGVTIGTFTGGSGGANLVIALNASANATSTTALINNLTYLNTDNDNPTTTTRNLRVVLTDGDGGTSVNNSTTMTVAAVNDAPVLDNSGSMTFTEDQTANSGQTVDSIIASAGDRITDPDTSAVEGIAITATTNGNGTWEYSTNSGSSWTSVGAQFVEDVLIYETIPFGIKLRVHGLLKRNGHCGDGDLSLKMNSDD